MENIIKKNEWKVRFEVTFYGNDSTRGSFREIREDTIVINEEFQINNKVNFDTAENVEINFLLWVDKLSIEKLTKVPHDYNNIYVRYDQEAIEVLEVTKI